MTLNCSLNPHGSVKSDLAFLFLIAQTVYNNGTTPEHHRKPGDREYGYGWDFFTPVARGLVPISRRINDLAWPTVVRSVPRGLLVSSSRNRSPSVAYVLHHERFGRRSNVSKDKNSFWSRAGPRACSYTLKPSALFKRTSIFNLWDTQTSKRFPVGVQDS